MNVEMLDEYEINPLTMMIKPFFKDGQLYSEVHDLEGVYRISKSPLTVVKNGCAYFGCSYEGRRNGTQALINITHKAPIIVDPHTSIFLFPTTSPLKPECIWIAHDLVISHHKGKRTTTLVSFQNNEQHELPISFYSFEQQISRTASLRIKYQQNISRMEIYQKPFKKTFYLNASEQKRSYEMGD